jgi:tetratricopeptide (TPR) repeat protein
MADVKSERLQMEALENLYSQKRFSEVLSVAKKLFQEYPNSFPIKLMHVKALKELNRLGEADETLNDLMLTYPNNLNLLAESGSLAVKRNKFDEALDFYNKILFLDPFNSEAKEAIDRINTIKEKHSASGSGATGESLDFLSYQNGKMESGDTLPEIDSKELHEFLESQPEEPEILSEADAIPSTADESLKVDITSEIGGEDGLDLDFGQPKEQASLLDIDLDETTAPPPPTFEEITGGTTTPPEGAYQFNDDNEAPEYTTAGVKEPEISPTHIGLDEMDQEKYSEPESTPEPAEEEPVSVADNLDLGFGEPESSPEPMEEEPASVSDNLDLGFGEPESSPEPMEEEPASVSDNLDLGFGEPESSPEPMEEEPVDVSDNLDLGFDEPEITPESVTSESDQLESAEPKGNSAVVKDLEITSTHIDLDLGEPPLSLAEIGSDETSGLDLSEEPSSFQPETEEPLESAEMEPETETVAPTSSSFDLDDLDLDVSSSDQFDEEPVSESTDQVEKPEYPSMWPAPDDTKMPPSRLDQGFAPPPPTIESEPEYTEPEELIVPEAVIPSPAERKPFSEDTQDTNKIELQPMDQFEKSEAPEPVEEPKVQSAQDEEPPSSESSDSVDEDDAGFVTESAAKLYVQQGLYEDALSIYEKLYIREQNDHYLNQINLVKHHRINQKKIEVLSEFLRVLQAHQQGD